MDKDELVTRVIRRILESGRDLWLLFEDFEDQEALKYRDELIAYANRLSHDPELAKDWFKVRTTRHLRIVGLFRLVLTCGHGCILWSEMLGETKLGN